MIWTIVKILARNLETMLLIACNGRSCLVFGETGSQCQHKLHACSLIGQGTQPSIWIMKVIFMHTKKIAVLFFAQLTDLTLLCTAVQIVTGLANCGRRGM
jgi:hypothetical protein